MICYHCLPVHITKLASLVVAADTIALSGRLDKKYEYANINEYAVV